jgi:predicted nucleic acid-binding protein
LKIIVDTNIVFSAILNIDSKIARILLYSENQFEFYSCEFLKIEIAKHKNKILKITGYSEDDFYQVEYLITKNIRFVNHHLIDEVTIIKSEIMLKNIDIDDAPFLALSIDLKAKLWTGDKKLLNALNKAQYKDVLITEQLVNKHKF